MLYQKGESETAFDLLEFGDPDFGEGPNLISVYLNVSYSGCFVVP